MLRDIASLMDPAASIAPGTYTATQTGAAVSKGQNESCAVVFVTGAITDGTFTPSVEHSDSAGAGWEAVPPGFLDGSLANLTANAARKVGYHAGKEFVRPIVTVAGAVTGGRCCALVVRGHPKRVHAK